MSVTVESCAGAYRDECGASKSTPTFDFFLLVSGLFGGSTLGMLRGALPPCVVSGCRVGAPHRGFSAALGTLSRQATTVASDFAIIKAGELTAVVKCRFARKQAEASGGEARFRF